MFKVAVIGTGFAGLSASAYLSAAGYEVHVFEKNATAGGRARQLKTATGYVFDMGPSWYWMPDIFERFFNDFGYKAEDFYTLKLLDPSFDIVFPGQERMSVPADFEALCNLFESIEKGASNKLKSFMQDAQFKYEVGMKKLVYKPGLSLAEFLDRDLIFGALRLEILSSFTKHVKKYFSHPKLIALMEFPVLFLGAMPQDTPALYSLMNYAGLKLGTWYPKGGFGKIIESMVSMAKTHGTTFYFNSPIDKILVDKDKAHAIVVKGKEIQFDAIVAAADYHHVEEKLLEPQYRNYSEGYWSKKVFAPSCLIFYIGIRKKLKSIEHHTLFFEEDLVQHSKEIYKNPQWPTKPLFYVCCPSRSDELVAPENHENLFLLMPIATNLEDNSELREKYYKIMMERLESYLGEDISGDVDFKESYCVSDFILDYNSYKGNAYGLANTLMQTANLKPKISNRKVKNLFYSGQLTVPGPGVPPSLISGKLAAEQVCNYLNKEKHEVII